MKDLTPRPKEIGDLKMPRYPTEVGGCFIAGTLVHTDKGLVPIEQIKVGDRVLSQPEATGEKAYKRVVNTFAYDDKEVWVVKYTTADEYKPTRDDVLYHLYATANHPFWVEGLGWTAAEQLVESNKFRLADGTWAMAVQVWPVLRTPRPHMGWVSADTLSSIDGLERAHIVDFNNGCNLWQYPMRRRHEASVPYAGGLGSSCIDEVFDSVEMCKIFEGGDRRFKARVYNLEVEDFHSYYVGELGVWAHNRNCY